MNTNTNVHLLLSEEQGLIKLRLYIAKRILDIGACESLKQKDESFFFLLIQVYKRHPKGYSLSLFDRSISDIQIQEHKLQDKFALLPCLILADGKPLPISWSKCLQQVYYPKYYERLAEAMHYEIDDVLDDIYTLRKQNPPLHCTKCSLIINRDISINTILQKMVHLIRADFLIDLNPEDLPEEIDICNDTYCSCLRSSDLSFRTRWTEYFYHRIHNEWFCLYCLLN